jgi:hypothetical protein
MPPAVGQLRYKMADKDYKTQAHALLGLELTPGMGDMDEVDDSPAIEPVVVKQVPRTPITVKNDEMLHLAYDAKLKDPDTLTQQFENMDLDSWSKFVSRIKEKQVKVDTTITAMGIFAMFPVVTDETMP